MRIGLTYLLWGLNLFLVTAFFELSRWINTLANGGLWCYYFTNCNCIPKRIIYRPMSVPEIYSKQFSKSEQRCLDPSLAKAEQLRVTRWDDLTFSCSDGLRQWKSNQFCLTACILIRCCLIKIRTKINRCGFKNLLSVFGASTLAQVYLKVAHFWFYSAINELKLKTAVQERSAGSEWCFSPFVSQWDHLEGTYPP